MRHKDNGMEVRVQKHGHLYSWSIILNQGTMAIQKEWQIFSTNSVEQESFFFFLKNTSPYLTLYAKINSKWIIDLKENISRQRFLR